MCLRAEVEKRYRDIDGQIRRCKRKIRVLKSEYEKQDKLDKGLLEQQRFPCSL